MWIAERNRKGRETGGTAFTGPVTVSGDPARVYLPGGYHWAPGLGDDVLVLKAGESGEKPCAVGVPTKTEGEALQPGEVLITGGKCSIKLGLDRRIEVTGLLTVNGTRVGPEPEVEEDG